eukprot:11579290-Alexandrium_andersonii.AAC.1
MSSKPHARASARTARRQVTVAIRAVALVWRRWAGCGESRRMPLMRRRALNSRGETQRPRSVLRVSGGGLAGASSGRTRPRPRRRDSGCGSKACSRAQSARRCLLYTSDAADDM